MLTPTVHIFDGDDEGDCNAMSAQILWFTGRFTVHVCGWDLQAVAIVRALYLDWRFGAKKGESKLMIGAGFRYPVLVLD